MSNVRHHTNQSVTWESAVKTEYLPLVGAIVAAAASIAVVAYTQYGALRLDRQKWEQSQAEQRHKALTDAVVSYARDASSAIQRAEVLTWTAQNDPSSVNTASLSEYDKNAITALTTLAANRLLVSAQDANMATRIDPVAMAYYRADECITKAAVVVRKDKPEGIRQLASCKAQSSAAAQVMRREFEAVLAKTPAPVSER
jgi:hypothetical protein